MPSPTTSASFKYTVSGSQTAVSQVASASFAVTRASIDVTPIGQSYRSHQPGIVEGTATVELFYDSSAHAAMMANFESGTVVPGAEIVWASGKSVKGDALIQDFSLSVAPNGVAQATLLLVFSGAAITITE